MVASVCTHGVTVRNALGSRTSGLNREFPFKMFEVETAPKGQRTACKWEEERDAEKCKDLNYLMKLGKWSLEERILPTYEMLWMIARPF